MEKPENYLNLYDDVWRSEESEASLQELDLSQEASPVHSAIAEVSRDYVTGTRSLQALTDSDGSGTELTRGLASYARYPETAAGFSDTDWNPYGTESDSNTPRSKGGSRLAGSQLTFEPALHSTDLHTLTPSLAITDPGSSQTTGQTAVLLHPDVQLEFSSDSVSQLSGERPYTLITPYKVTSTAAVDYNLLQRDLEEIQKSLQRTLGPACLRLSDTGDIIPSTTSTPEKRSRAWAATSTGHSATWQTLGPAKASKGGDCLNSDGADSSDSSDSSHMSAGFRNFELEAHHMDGLAGQVTRLLRQQSSELKVQEMAGERNTMSNSAGCNLSSSSSFDESSVQAVEDICKRLDMSALSSAETSRLAPKPFQVTEGMSKFLSSQLSKVTERTFNHSIQLEPQVVHCYPLYATAEPGHPHTDNRLDPASGHPTETSSTRGKERYRPYRPPGSQEVYYTDTEACSDTTAESSHLGSDDAQAPKLPDSVFGSRREPPSSSGIYGNRKPNSKGAALVTIDEKCSVDDEISPAFSGEGDKELEGGRGSHPSGPTEDTRHLDSEHNGHTGKVDDTRLNGDPRQGGGDPRQGGGDPQLGGGDPQLRGGDPQLGGGDPGESRQDGKLYPSHLEDGGSRQKVNHREGAWMREAHQPVPSPHRPQKARTVELTLENMSSDSQATDLDEEPMSRRARLLSQALAQSCETDLNGLWEEFKAMNESSESSLSSSRLGDLADLLRNPSRHLIAQYMRDREEYRTHRQLRQAHNAGSQGDPTRRQALNAGSQGDPTRRQALNAGSQGDPTRRQALNAGSQGDPTRRQAHNAGSQGDPTRRQAHNAGSQGDPTRRQATTLVDKSQAGNGGKSKQVKVAEGMERVRHCIALQREQSSSLDHSSPLSGDSTSVKDSSTEVQHRKRSHPPRCALELLRLVKDGQLTADEAYWLAQQRINHNGVDHSKKPRPQHNGVDHSKKPRPQHNGVDHSKKPRPQHNGVDHSKKPRPHQQYSPYARVENSIVPSLDVTAHNSNDGYTDKRPVQDLPSKDSFWKKSDVPPGIAASLWKKVVQKDPLASKTNHYEVDPLEDKIEYVLDNKHQTNSLTLQEAFLANKQSFISKSRQRQKRLQLARESRRFQECLRLEREAIFAQQPPPSSKPAHPYSDNLFLPKRRVLTRQEMKELTHKRYKKLPEVLERQELDQRKAQCQLNKLRAQIFNHRVQRETLRKFCLRGTH
ncbi:uncharacterized protein LOC131955266 isoform X2 [Physella acuta]|uniref:uncharacterized protein LOC131955266 isoform X2 n=1 Tax=Physella acuta TaxID=109671 RepID=UPI0027DC463C|nr:uncharacterized protein LOC131955266 isoform X2 [Physella acuta]